MGDRVSVTLTVLNEQADEAKTFFEGYEADHVSNDNVFTHFSFYEVNYGQLQFLNNLMEAGIAFESNWDAGDGYCSGTEYLRFMPDGTYWRRSIDLEEVNPSITECMKLIDNYDELKAFVVNHYNETTPPSWEHQAEYGKIFRTLNLIT